MVSYTKNNSLELNCFYCNDKTNAIFASHNDSDDDHKISHATCIKVLVAKTGACPDCSAFVEMGSLFSWKERCVIQLRNLAYHGFRGAVRAGITAAAGCALAQGISDIMSTSASTDGIAKTIIGLSIASYGLHGKMDDLELIKSLSPTSIMTVGSSLACHVNPLLHLVMAPVVTTTELITETSNLIYRKALEIFDAITLRIGLPHLFPKNETRIVLLGGALSFAARHVQEMMNSGLLEKNFALIDSKNTGYACLAGLVGLVTAIFVIKDNILPLPWYRKAIYFVGTGIAAIGGSQIGSTHTVGNGAAITLMATIGTACISQSKSDAAAIILATTLFQSNITESSLETAAQIATTAGLLVYRGTNQIIHRSSRLALIASAAYLTAAKGLEGGLGIIKEAATMSALSEIMNEIYITARG